jgi:hypothetical protein
MSSELVQIDSAELIHANFYQISSTKAKDVVPLEMTLLYQKQL